MDVSDLVVHAAYKAVCIASGTVFAYMGYRLFLSRIFAEAGDLEASWGNNRIMLKRAAPGTFFALFGTLIILLTVWRGLVSFKSAGPDSSAAGDFGTPNIAAQVDHDRFEQKTKDISTP